MARLAPAEVESQVSSLREALKGADIEPVRKGLGSLTDVLSRVSTKAYQASSSEGSPNGRKGDGAGDGAGEAGEETVEGEFKEV